jgi:hypothetical protein
MAFWEDGHGPNIGISLFYFCGVSYANVSDFYLLCVLATNPKKILAIPEPKRRKEDSRATDVIYCWTDLKDINTKKMLLGENETSISNRLLEEFVERLNFDLMRMDTNSTLMIGWLYFFQ